jgi:hypothetical protein
MLSLARGRAISPILTLLDPVSGSEVGDFGHHPWGLLAEAILWLAEWPSAADVKSSVRLKIA